MTERELPKAENAALKAFITSDRLNFVEEVGVKANAKANAAAKSTIRLVDPPIGNENWPKPRFRSLRDFRAEYQRSLKWSAAESSIQAVSTRSRRGQAPARHHGS